MNHTQKIRLARRMITAWEIKNHIPIFSSKAWISRRKAIAARFIRLKPIRKSWWRRFVDWITGKVKCTLIQTEK